MKKVYLLITAAMLLIGSSGVSAETVATIINGETSTDYESFEEAFDNWTEGTTLKLQTSEVFFDHPSYYDITESKTLDLNGKKLTWSSNSAIYVYQNAKLLITDNSSDLGEFVYINNRNYESAVGLVTGDAGTPGTFELLRAKMAFRAPNNKSAAMFLNTLGSTLNISNSVVNAECLIGQNLKGTINLQGSTKINTNFGNGAFFFYGSTEKTDKNYTVLNIGENAEVNNPSGWGLVIYHSNSHAYGVVANIDGKISANACITINGEVRDIEGNVPQITINDGAVLGNAGDECTATACIYAAGYGIWNIGAATLKANTPIYAKSGTININGATIEACGEKADPQPNNNGFYTTGDAIVMDTNKSYAGAVLLNVYGDAQIKSTNGYAIQEVITNGTTSSAAGIAITGDETMLAGGAGSVQMTDNFRNAMIDGSSSTYEWILNGISGGVYSELPSVVADGYVAQEVEISGETYYKVVPKPEEPVAPASQTTYIINNSEWDYAVNLTNSSAIVVKTGATFKVKGIEVNRADADDVSKVTVEPGAKLIVGSNGIQTNDANALALQSDATNGMGMLLYDGSTTATSPYGTAELYLYSKKIADDNYIWQHFGIPTVATPSIEKNVTISVNKWDVKKGWIWDGGSSVLTDAWTGFNIATNHEEAGSIVKFSGQLIGNDDATLVLDKYGYNALANSYTAPANLKSVIDAVYDASTDGAVWIYSAKEALETGIKQFHSFGSDTPEDESLNPMQAFFVLHESDASDNATINYEEAVLGYNTRDAVANDYNKATLTITGGGEADSFTLYEGEQFSASAMDKGYDIKQMNHDFIQIYAVQNGENYSSVATDDAENLELTIKTKAATEYTLSFSGIPEGYGVKLTDVKSGAEIVVGNDKTYTFTADANTTAVRFRFGKSEVSADEANADAVKIWSANGSLFVEGNAAEADIEIINLSGVKVASAKASGEAVQTVSISNLASGVYVVRVGNTAAKIVK